MSLAVTGIAGPSGGTPDKPVGTVWFGWAINDTTHTEMRVFSGDRSAVRPAAARYALQRLTELLIETV